MAIWMLVLAAVLVGSAEAETLRAVLVRGQVPVARFSAAELDGEITSFAVTAGDPFLLAYYVDRGTGSLEAPIRVIRYARGRGELRRAEVREPAECLGSAISIVERGGTVYAGTHLNPSVGCVLVLSAAMEFKRALPGLVLAFVGNDHVIVRESEMHFAPVHPLNLSVYDSRRETWVKLHPYAGDSQRAAYSASIRPYLSEAWCRENNSPCNPEMFNVEPGKVSVNDAAGAFGFEAEFSISGNRGEGAPPVRRVGYVFRLRNGAWEHREFLAADVRRLFGVESVEALVMQKP